MTSRMLAWGIVLLACPMSLLPASAAERIYCAASDDHIDLSLELGFDKRDPERLHHFRGIAALKGSAPQAGTQRFRLESEMIRQYWIDDKDLRLSLRNALPSRRPALGLSIVLQTERKSMGTLRFEGVYEAKLVRHTQSGTAAGETMMDETAPIFCAIKR